jgi:hypothetical protein
LAQHDLSGGEHRDDVEVVVVAEVGHAEDLALHGVLSAGDREVRALHQALVDGVGLERRRLQHRRHAVGRRLREQLEAERRHAGARGPREARVPREDARQALFLHHLQRLMQAFNQ